MLECVISSGSILIQLKSESICSKAIHGLLTPKGPMSVNGFLGSSGRLSRRQKHE
jgi:hypothetical protein